MVELYVNVLMYSFIQYIVNGMIGLLVNALGHVQEDGESKPGQQKLQLSMGVKSVLVLALLKKAVTYKIVQVIFPRTYFNLS